MLRILLAEVLEGLAGILETPEPEEVEAHEVLCLRPPTRLWVVLDEGLKFLDPFLKSTRFVEAKPRPEQGGLNDRVAGGLFVNLVKETIALVPQASLHSDPTTRVKGEREELVVRITVDNLFEGGEGLFPLPVMKPCFPDPV